MYSLSFQNACAEQANNAICVQSSNERIIMQRAQPCNVCIIMRSRN